MSTRKKSKRSEGATRQEADVGAAELGRRIAGSVRALRASGKLSLDELAARSGVSRATLSQIETAKTNPTLSILWRIAAALGVPFSRLLGQEQVGRVHVLRREGQQVIRTADGQMESRPLSPGGALPGAGVYELRLPPHAVSASEAHPPGTVENLIVLVGALRLTVGEEVCDLGAGDSVCFRADVAHVYENRGRTEARCHDVIVYGE